MLQRSPIRLMILILLLLIAGCSNSSDERLAEFARQSVAQQAKQNESLARQSEAVVQESSKLAEAAQRLVESDAQARREMLQGQQVLHKELQTERAGLDRQHEVLETERRTIAEQRQRDPIIAATIQSATLLLASLLPLAVCFYALRHLAGESADGEALAELLVYQLADEQRRLPQLEHESRAVIEHRPDEPASPSNESAA